MTKQRSRISSQAGYICVQIGHALYEAMLLCALLVLSIPLAAEWIYKKIKSLKEAIK